jgi:hypothetical protein
MNDMPHNEHQSEAESDFVLAEVVTDDDLSESDDATGDNKEWSGDDLVLGDDLDSMLQRLDALTGSLESGDLERPGYRPPSAGSRATATSLKAPHVDAAPLDGTPLDRGMPATLPPADGPSPASPRPADRRTRLANDLDSLRRSARRSQNSPALPLDTGTRRLTTCLVLAALTTATSTLLLLLAGSTGTWTYFGGVVAALASVFCTLRFLNEGKRLLAANPNSFVE